MKKQTAEDAECWKIKRSEKSPSIIVCKGETAFEHGDPSVGIFGGEVTVKDIYSGKYGVSALVESNGEEYEEDISMFQFNQENILENLHNIKLELDILLDQKEDEKEEIRNTYTQKYGEDLKKGQRVIQVEGNKRGIINDIDREIKATVKWDDEKKTKKEPVSNLMDEKEWKEFKEEFDRHASIHDIMLEAKDRKLRDKHRF